MTQEINNTTLDKDQTTTQVNLDIADKGIINISIFEFMQLYLSCGNVYDAIDCLEKKYNACDFKVSLFLLGGIYVLQNREDVKKVLSANTLFGYQYSTFDVSNGHPSIAGMQAFQNSSSDEKNHVWNSFHKSMVNSVANDKELITRLVTKHMPHLLREGTFSLDVAFEEFMVSLWCEYLFGSNVSSQKFSETRNKMLSALRYTFYDSRLKVIPYVGDLASKLYRYINQNEFDEINDEFKQYIVQAHDGLICRMREQLKNIIRLVRATDRAVIT